MLRDAHVGSMLQISQYARQSAHILLIGLRVVSTVEADRVSRIEVRPP